MSDVLTPPSPREAFDMALDVIGGQNELSRRWDIPQSTINGWVNRLGRVPAEYVLRLEADTGIHRHYLRPDIYPESDYPPAQLPVDAANHDGSASMAPPRKDAESAGAPT